jgi:hypothetical protein
MVPRAHDAVIRYRANTGYRLRKTRPRSDRTVLDPLVDPGNSPRRHEACPVAHSARL